MRKRVSSSGSNEESSLICAAVRSGDSITGPLSDKFEWQAHRAGGDQNVRENDDRVHAQNAARLQRNFHCEFRSSADFQKVVLLADGAVFRQITPRLPHDPYRHALDRLAAAGAQKEVLPVHGFRRMAH